MTRYLLDNDPRREQRRQSLLLDRLEGRFRPAVTREIKRAMREMIDAYGQTGEIGSPRDHYDKMEATFQRMAEGAVLTFAKRVMDQALGKGLGYTFGDGGLGFVGRLDAPYYESKEEFDAMMRRMALSYVGQEAVRQKITSITETTRDQIIAQVNRGYQDGLGVAEIARMISGNVEQISRWRGALIARTETHGAANFGADQAARETGLQLRKEWVSAEDERTRPDHREADGQVVDMDAKFDVGADRLKYPGDPAGRAAQTINCRCAVSHVVQD